MPPITLAHMSVIILEVHTLSLIFQHSPSSSTQNPVHQHISELVQLLCTQGLCENVGYLFMCTNIHQINLLCKNLLPDVMVVHLNVLVFA